jgi:hypothetical protein
MVDDTGIDLTQMTDVEKRGYLTQRVLVLFVTGEKFCVEQGLSKDFIYAVYKTGNDWEFILKVDALLEVAAKLILRSGLLIKIEQTREFENKSVEVALPTEVIHNKMLEDFVDCLPMDGRTSLLKLLEAAGLPDYDLGFIRATRQVRNAFAHDIRNVDSRLIDIIKSRKEKSHLLKHLSAIEKFDEASLIADYERDPSFLRYCIFDSTLRFLLYAYHLGKS